MNYQLKNLDRCDSEQLKEMHMIQNISDCKEENKEYIKPDINELLQKIQAINNSKYSNSRNHTEGYEKCIVKQGKQSDEPHQPGVLAWSRMKNNKKSQNYSEHSLKQRNYGKEEDKNSQKASANFYKYCTDEIVRVSNENSTLSKRLQKALQELSNQRRVSQALKIQNSKMIKQIEELKGNYTRSNEQVILLRQQISNIERANIYKQKSQINVLADKTKIYEEELNRYRKMINEKDENNLRLVNQIKSLKLESVKFFEWREENIRLGKKISELMALNKNLQEKVAGKSQSVDHLWSIKEIEYGNIMKLISLGKNSKPQQ